MYKRRWSQTLVLPSCSVIDEIEPQPQPKPWTRVPTVGNAFVTRWNISSPEPFVFPLMQNSNYEITSVHWGDNTENSGTYSQSTESNLVELTHLYAKP